MICDVAAEIFFLLLMCLGIANGTNCYAVEFSDDVWDCPDFDNQVLQCAPLQVGMVEGKEAELGLNGKINILEAIEEGIQMVVEIFKILDIGKEFLYRVQGDICASLKEQDTPWYPMVQSMKITKCPIETGSYSIKDMRMDLNSSKDVMNHEMCGEYYVNMKMTKALDTVVSCHALTVTMSEYDC